MEMKVPDVEILDVREKKVILDCQLAKLYGVETKNLKRAVKANMKRFPSDFMFELTKEEFDSLRCKNFTSNTRGGTRYMPYAFTEYGIAMLSSVLRSETAIDANIRIMRAFAEMRRSYPRRSDMSERIEVLEYNQLSMRQQMDETAGKVELILNQFVHAPQTMKQGIFYDGQVYDAYAFVAGLVRRAVRRIVLIDNYIDETVLTLLDKRAEGVEATIYTSGLNKQLRLDIARHNSQYPPIDVQAFSKAHDRFLIIDDEVYLIGASIKDLGKKWFGFTLMENTSATELLSRINQ